MIGRWIAWTLPRRVALHAFVRVYSAWGELGPDYDPVYRTWEEGKKVAAVDPVLASSVDPSTRDKSSDVGPHEPPTEDVKIDNEAE